MFDIGWTEMVVLGVVALLVLGPKELPGLLRTVGRYAGRFRDMASEFRRQIDDISDEIDTKAQLKKLVEKNVDVGIPDLFEDAPASKDKKAPKSKAPKSKESDNG